MATSRYIKQVNKTDNNWLLPLLVVLFSGLGIAFSIGGYTAGRYFTILLVGVSLLLNVEDLLCFIMFCFPFSSMLKLSAATISVLPILYLIVIVKLLAYKKLNLPLLSLFCYMALALLQILTIPFYEAAYTGIISLLLNAALVLFSASYFNSEKFDKPYLLTSASLFFGSGATVMLLLNDLFPHLPSMVDAAKQLELEKADRYAATILDPNELAQILLIAIGLLIAVMPSIRSKWGKFFSMVMMVYMAFTGLRTHSKSYVISLVLLFAVIMLTYLRIVAKKGGSGKAFLRLVPVLALMLIVGIFLLVYVVIPVFETRSSEQTDLLTNRLGIWERYLSALLQSPDTLLIGCGAGNVTGLIRMIGQNTNTVPHNAYLEYVIQFGLVGLALLLTSWKNALSLLKQKSNTYFVIPLAAFLITAFGISVNANDCPFLLLTLLAMPLPPSTDKPMIQARKRGVSHG